MDMPPDFDQLIANETPDAVILTSTRGEIVHWTKAAETVFGHTGAEAVGRMLDELIVPMDRIQEERRILQNTLVERDRSAMKPCGAGKTAR